MASTYAWPTVVTNREPDWLPAIVALTEQGYAVLPGAMPEVDWRKLRAEADHLRASDAVSAARVGRTDGLRLDSRTRDGCWLRDSMPADAFMGWMDAAGHAEQGAVPGARDLEAHYAHYPVRTSYETHVHRHHHSDARVVSAVMYLNEEWPARVSLDAGQPVRTPELASKIVWPS
jgi:SM-20-related protein